MGSVDVGCWRVTLVTLPVHHPCPRMSFLRSPPKRAVHADVDNPHRRVVLLLDMDCFYAQCEVVRLGLDREMPLALVQVRVACMSVCCNSCLQHSKSALFPSIIPSSFNISYQYDSGAPPWR